jgi:TonB family protein
MLTLKSINSDRVWRGAKQVLLSVAALALSIGMALPARAGDIPGVKKNVTPAYPQAAKNLKIFGEVYVEAVVDPDGNVKDVRPVSGAMMLSQAAKDAVRQWKFAPSASERVVVVAFNFVNP